MVYIKEDYETEDSQKKEWDEIDKLLHSYELPDYHVREFVGTRVSWQDIILPEDFEALVEYISPMIMLPATLFIEKEDVISICDFDLEKKICRSGDIRILDITGKDIVPIFKKELEKLRWCQNCILMTSGDFALKELGTVMECIENKLGGNKNIAVGWRPETDINMRIQFVCRIERKMGGTNSEEIPVFKSAGIQVKETEFEIPSFLR